MKHIYRAYCGIGRENKIRVSVASNLTPTCTPVRFRVSTGATMTAGEEAPAGAAVSTVTFSWAERSISQPMTTPVPMAA
jgi:hypothetical protein